MLSNPACSDMLNSFQFGSAALYSYSNLALLPSSFVQECGVPRRLPPGTEARPQPRRLRPNLYPRITVRDGPALRDAYPDQSECAHLQTDLSGLRSLSIFPMHKS